MQQQFNLGNLANEIWTAGSQVYVYTQKSFQTHASKKKKKGRSVKSVKHVLVFQRKTFLLTILLYFEYSNYLKIFIKEKDWLLQNSMSLKMGNKNAKTGEIWSKIYFTYVLRSRQKTVNAKLSCGKLILVAFY